MSILFKSKDYLRKFFLFTFLLGFIALGTIGGCNNNSGSNQMADALTIEMIDGNIVEAVDAEFFLRKWQEGDPDNNIFLNGSLVSELTQAEETALKSAYQSGFFIALVDPILLNIDDLHNILGLKKLIVDTGPMDLFAVSREFNVSGVRYFRLNSLPDDGIPTELRFERERVERLIAWENTQSTETTAMRETDMSNNLMQLADSVSYTDVLSIKPGKKLTSRVFGIETEQDFEGHFQGFIQGWSVHSVEENDDFYFFQLEYFFAPTTTGRTSSTQSTWPCNTGYCDSDPAFICTTSNSGVSNYGTNNFFPFAAFDAPDVLLIDSSPPTTEGTITTSSSISTTISGSVSYSERDGAGIGLSDSTTYENSRSYSSSAVKTINLGADDSQGNNSAWNFDVMLANAARASFQPTAQWYWQAKPETRTIQKCNVDGEEYCLFFDMEIVVNYHPISCAPTLSFAEVSEAFGWGLNFPIPPVPPPAP